MIPLVRRFFHDLLWSPSRARLWFRGFLMWAATLSAQIALTPQAELVTWNWRGWAIRLAISGVAGLAMFVNAGEMNPKAPPPPGAP